jgi:hypothetical protein
MEGTMTQKYQSGTFCKDIKCERHIPLEAFEGDEYMKQKAINCKDCYAWMFLGWLQDRHWRIVLTTIPEMSSRELAARIKGIDMVTVKDLTDDEILCL